MAIPDPLLKVLFEVDFWATRQLLAACCALPPEQFQRDLGIGPGSLERTLTHLVGTLSFFADRLARRPARPRLESDGQRHDAAELTEHFERAAVELEQAAGAAQARHALSDTLNWTDSDEGQIEAADQLSYAVAFAQIIDHGIHHRTQAMDMLELLRVAQSVDWHPFDWDEAVRFGK